MEKTKTPLVFVHLGDDFPAYGLPSLRLAQETANVPIIVLAQIERPADLDIRVYWERIEDTYNSDDFQEFRRKSALPEDFRDGFWFKAVERLFVLRDFVEKRQISTFFHGELDCLFFDLREVEERISRASRRGLFLPRETPDRCLASLIYANEPGVMTKLCQHIEQHVFLGNEMNILGALNHDESSPFFALPAAPSLFDTVIDAKARSWPTGLPKSEFIVDGAVIGRWLFGVDPRNTSGRGTRNRIQNQIHTVPFEPPLADIVFRQCEQNPLQIFARHRESKNELRVAVIHVHSKIHAIITPEFVRRIITSLARGRSVVIVPPSRDYYLYLFKKAVRQARLTFVSLQKTTAFIRQVISLDWWRGLVARLTAR